MRSIIIDADTGIDDAVAIAMACYTGSLNVRLITTVAGNSSVEEVTKNTLNLLQAIDKNVTVAVGANAPLYRKKDDSIQVHGYNGLGNYQFPECKLSASHRTAIQEMGKVILNNRYKTTIVALGPLTNIANLLRTFPRIHEKIDKVVISAGLLYDDYDNPYMGFNVMQDPESAEMVLRSGIDIEVCPSNHGHDAYLTPEEVEKVKNTNKTGEMLEYIFRSYRDRHVKIGIATHDPCAIAYLVHPEYFTTEVMDVNVRYVNGSGVLDFDNLRTGYMKVATSIDVKKFKRFFFNTLRKMP